MGRPILPGDEVVVVVVRAVDDLARLYGDAARKPFVVERIVRQPRYAVTGGGMMVWRSHLRRVRTKLQIARDAAKAAP